MGGSGAPRADAGSACRRSPRGERGNPDPARPVTPVTPGAATRPLVVFTSLLALAGCLPADAPTACTDIAIASVIVDVSTADGADAAFEVAYRTAADDLAPCDDFGDPGQYVCGYEIVGEVEIEVGAPGYAPQTHTVSVAATEDGCHVVTETLDVVLEPTADE